jgi:hypothetical protein
VVTGSAPIGLHRTIRPIDRFLAAGGVLMTVVASNKIWLEGSTARTDGLPVSANPYPAGSQESADWLEGYTTVEAEQLVASPDAGENL